MAVIRRLTHIAWRNVFRNRRRTLLTMAVLTIGSAGMILVGGFFANILEGLREQFIHSQTGHLQVSVKDFYRKGVTSPYDYLMRNSDEVKTVLESQDHVLYTVPRLIVSAMASSDKTSVAVTVLGTDADKERRMGSVKAKNSEISSMHIEEGTDLSSSDKFGAVLGKGLLSALGLKVGDSVTVVTTHEGGAIDSAQYIIRGTFVTIMKEVDDHVMKVNLASAQSLMGAQGAVHSLVTILDKTENAPAVQSQLREIFAAKGFSLEVMRWDELQPNYAQSKDMLEKIYAVIRIIICIVFFFSIANTVNMSLMERIREFGTMMAIGNQRGAIFFSILMEVVFLGALGAGAGLLVGSGVAEIVSALGIEMPPPPQGSNSYLAMISLSPSLLGATFVTALVCTVVSGMMPAWRAVRLRIVEALGYV